MTRVEYLGSDRLIYGVLGGPFHDSRGIAKLPFTVSVPIQQGETCEFAVQEKDLKFFDKATGLRTRPRAL